MEKASSASTQTELKNSQTKSESKSENTTGIFLAYDTIELRVYIEIANTANYSLLNPGCADENLLAEQWHKIVDRNKKESGTETYNILLDSYQDLLFHLSTLSAVKQTLTKGYIFLEYITAEADKPVMLEEHDLEYLASKKFKLDTSTPENYRKTLHKAFARSNQLITRVESKKKEILGMTSKEADGDEYGFQQLLANLTDALGFNLSDDISLARFNEYKKILKRKAEQANKNARGR